MTDDMKRVNHSHRNDPRNVFGEMFRRGASTKTDGGRTDPTTDSMAAVDHETPDEGANAVWERGRARTSDR